MAARNRPAWMQNKGRESVLEFMYHYQVPMTKSSISYNLRNRIPGEQGTHGTIENAVDDLVEHEWVHKLVDPSDRNTKVFVIAERGRDYFKSGSLPSEED